MISLKKKHTSFLRSVEFLLGILHLSDVEALIGNRGRKRIRSRIKKHEAWLCTGESCVIGETVYRRTCTDLEGDKLADINIAAQILILIGQTVAGGWAIGGGVYLKVVFYAVTFRAYTVLLLLSIYE